MIAIGGELSIGVSHGVHLLSPQFGFNYIERKRMALVKTEKGRAALNNRDTSLGVRERQMLVMSDGKRTPQDFQALFGADTQTTLMRLIALGFILNVNDAKLSQENMSATGTFRADALSGQKTAAVVAPVPTRARPPETAPMVVRAAPAAPASSSRSRRSVAGAKMYTFDILQMIRDIDAASWRLAIQASRDEKEVVENLLNALRFIHRKSGASYGRRVFDELHVTLPVEYLLDLECLSAELFSAERQA